MDTHVHDGTAWRKVKQWHAHDGSAWRKLKQAWVHDGSAWRKVFGGGPTALPSSTGAINDLAVYRPTASDPYCLYAATSNGVWKWDGTAWTQTSTAYSYALCASADGYLYAGGMAGSMRRWDGTAWTTIASLLSTANTVIDVGDEAAGVVALVNDGWNPSLQVERFAGGAWSGIGELMDSVWRCASLGSGAPVVLSTGGNIWRWVGGTWVNMARPMTPVSILGYGGQLYAGATDGVWRWDGSSWSQLTATPTYPQDLTIDGAILYAAASSGLWSWDGATWAQVHDVSGSRLARDPVTGTVYTAPGGGYTVTACPT